jgi:gliding motility-associated-like protein
MQRISNTEKLFCRKRVPFGKASLFLSLAMLLFLSASISAQVLTNQGAVISVTGGTVVEGDTIENVTTGIIENAGTINLSGHYINEATTSGDGFYNIKGNWVNTGSFTAGTSTVELLGNGLQKVINSGPGNFYKLVITNSSLSPTNSIRLFDEIEVSNTLTFNQGIIQTGTNKLFLTSFLSSSLIYTSGRIIGKFERGINATDNYLFPIGSESNYNPLNLKPNIAPSSGSVLTEFLPEDPDTLGLPIPDTSVDPGVEVYNVIKDGYWSLKSNNGFSVSDFDVNIDGAGFSDPNAVQEITRVIKRDAGGNWLVDGTHSDAVGSVAYRDNLTGNIAASTTHLALGNVRPLIIEQPQDTAVCDGTEAIFTVVATGVETLFYQWQEKRPGGGWRNLEDEGIYSGTETATLTISSASLDMDQNQYRVRISHKYGHVNWSERATLTVNPLPVALATPQVDTLCNEEYTFIELSSDVPGTTFDWVILYGAHLGASDGFDAIEGDTIQQQLFNPLDIPDSVVYRIVPTGPFNTYCIGHADTAVVYVNPTPRVEIVVVEDTICDGTTSTITVTSPTVLTSGSVKYDFTIEDVSGVIGDVSGQDEVLFQDPNVIEQTLTNHTDHYHYVEYRIHPYSVGSGRGVNCDFGNIRDSVFRIYVNPTPRVVVTVDQDTICDEQTSRISISSPTVLTSGVVKYDLRINDFSNEDNDVIGETTYLDQDLGFTDHTLENTTDTAQWVEYRVHPFTSGSGPGTNCDYGDVRDSVFRIYVNPTPNIFLRISDPSARISSDTVFCNGFDVLFDMNNYQLTTGTVKYHLEVTGADLGIIDGETPTTDSLDIANFTNTLLHSDSQIRELNYRFIPYIENAHGITGCYSGLDTTVNVKIVPVLSALEAPKVLDPGFFNITCHGLSDGEIVLTPQGGDLRYTYEIIWKDDAGNTLQTEQADYDYIEGLSAGIYEYDVIDTIGCFFTDTIKLTEPDTLAIDNHTVVSPQCYGDDPTGEVYVSLSGGVKTSAYYKEYKWEHALTEEMVGSAENLTGVISGPFTYTFKDYYNCSFDTMFIIPPANRLVSDTLTISEYGNYHISCNGASDGRVEVIGLGGTGSDTYTYKWYADPDDETPISDTTYIENMPAGTYYYWLRDANGCLLGEGMSEDSLVAIELTEPDPISFVRDENDLHPGGWDISCFGRSDGEINLQYLGGHTEYLDNEFTWSGDVSSADSILNGLSEGSYTVEVTDAFGCTGETTFILLQPPQITYDTIMSGFAGLNNVSCFGQSDGFIHLENVSGGGTKDTPGSYLYGWTPPEGVALDDETLQDQDNLPAGRYYFTITDQIGCSVLDSAEVIQPDSLYAIPYNSLRNGYEISCYNGSDGWVSLEPAGGTRPYSYNWSDETGSTTDTVITALNEGYYSVAITDPNGCENFYEWELQHPDTIVLNPDPILIECFGDTSTIRISPEGGVGGYSYLWEGSMTNRNLTGVTEGTYHVIVTDANGCEVGDSLYLEQRSRIMPEIVVRSDFNGRHISCHGAENAAIELLISGGNDSNYTFEWNTSTGDNNTYFLTGLAAGTYTVNGEDASGCSFDTVKQVIQPSDINVMYTAKDPLCEGNVNGSISISVVGGTPIIGSPIYNYSLNGIENLPLPEFDSLPEGDYLIVVKDANNCTDTTTVALVAPEPLAIVYETTPAECRDKADGTVTINQIIGGTLPYSINGGTSQYFDNLLPGDFVIELIDGNDCRLIDTAYIEALRLLCLNPPNAFTPNGDGANDVWVLDEDENGVNDMYLYPDAELRIFNRWGELVYYSDNVADEPWDGTYKGRDLPVDSYHYVLDLGLDNEPITGSVTIIR